MRRGKGPRRTRLFLIILLWLLGSFLQVLWGLLFLRYYFLWNIICSFISMSRIVVNFWPCDAFLQAPFWNWQTVLISNVYYIITPVLCWAATIIISEWMKFITFASERWLLCCMFRLQIYEKHQWCDLFWRPLALYTWNFAVTTRTWSAAHASSRSFSGGSKTGLDKKAEIERKTCCDKIYLKMLM